MQSPQSKCPSEPSHTCGWVCRWLPVHQDVHQVQSRFDRSLVRLMFSVFVLYVASAVRFLPDDCQASFSLVPASRALSLAGLLIQLAFYHGIPFQVKKIHSLPRTEETRSRVIVLLASLWVPFVPFVLSIVLLCFGTNRDACISALWQAINPL